MTDEEREARSKVGTRFLQIHQEIQERVEIVDDTEQLAYLELEDQMNGSLQKVILEGGIEALALYDHLLTMITTSYMAIAEFLGMSTEDYLEMRNMSIMKVQGG